MDAKADRNSDIVLEPLVFPTKKTVTADISEISPSSQPVKCILCNEEFNLLNCEKQFLAHLLTNHKMVIADINYIANLESYLSYWQGKLKEDNLTEYCSVIKTNCGATDLDKSENYFLLSDALPEDKQIREKLQKNRLDYVLLCQQIEREDNSFSRRCLFCNSMFTGNRSILLEHMGHDHNFQIGRPDNIVFINHFLDLIEEKLNKFQCLHCEKFFKDRAVLKEHMRKKLHKKLNANNSDYDKFYVINYLELGKNWRNVQLEIAEDKEKVDSVGFNAEDENETWDDWTGNDDNGAFCLFCSYSSRDSQKLLQHLNDEHNFDINAIRDNMNLDFYLQVKLVNYIRRQVYQNRCVSCNTEFDNKPFLMEHMASTKHISDVPEKTVWDQPQYFFPTYENDNLLCVLEEAEDNNSAASVAVLAESIIKPSDSILENKSVLKDLM